MTTSLRSRVRVVGRKRLLALAAAGLAAASVAPACALDNERVAEQAPRAVRFTLQRPGSALPSGRACARRVQRVPEQRRQNVKSNGTTPGRYRVRRIDGAEGPGAARFASRIDGAFTGTTDELIQWAACKWGFNEEVVRAVVYTESSWDQATVGDGGHSFGLMQIKVSVHDGTWPWARRSSAFNLDYALAWHRSCFEGYFGHWVPARARGDAWGCIGLWYTGDWNWREARDGYLHAVRTHLAEKPWRDWETAE